MALKDYFANLSQWQRIALLALPAALAGYVYWAYLLGPLRAEIDRLNRELGQLQADLQQKRQIAANKAGLEREIQELQAKLAQVLTRLPEEKEIPRLLSQVNTLGREAGLEFLLFKPGSALSREFYAEIPIDIKVEGGYHSLGVFFDKVSKMERIVNISDLKMAPASGKKGVVAEFRATTYIFAGVKGGKGGEAKKGGS